MNVSVERTTRAAIPRVVNESARMSAEQDGERDDDRLMGRFCAGDETAFNELHAKYAQPIHAFIRRMVNQPSLADDLLQTTFMTVVRSRGRYEAGTSVRSWMYAIAANASRDSLRRAKVRGFETAPTAGNEPSVNPPMPDPPAARALQSALDSLHPDQREAVLLHKVHGLSFQEIAETLGISVSAAKVRAHRGYEHLRARLASLGDWT